MKTSPFIAIVALAVVVLAGGYFFWSRSLDMKSAATQIEFSSTETRLFGRISQIDTSNGTHIAKIELLENIEGQQNMENAAIADGVCTLDQVQKSECLNNPFYIRQIGKVLDLELDPKANIRMYAREPRGGMLVDAQSRTYVEQKSLEQFTDLLTQNNPPDYLRDIPFYFGIEGGKVVRIQEKYVP